MPGKVKESQQLTPTPAGEIKVSKFLSPGLPREVFMVLVLELSEGIIELMNEKDKLDSAREDLLALTEGKVRSERPIEIAGARGLELEILPRGGGIVRARVFATPDKVVEVFAQVSQLRLGSDDVAKFLDSVKLEGVAEPRP